MKIFPLFLWFSVLLERTISFTVKVTVDVDAVVSVGGATKVPNVFGITAYGSGIFSMLESSKGQDYLHQHNIDSVGVPAGMERVLPEHRKKMSLEDLEKWFSGKGPAKLFKKTRLHSLLKSNGIRKGGGDPLYCLMKGECAYAEKWECAEHGTPLPLNGSTLEEKYAWWSELGLGMLTQLLDADPYLEYVQILNEPDLHFERDGFNVSHYIDFYHALVERLKGKWPQLKYGGPVTWDPPNGPIGIKSPSTSFHTWFTYMRPFLDAVVPLGYLDFVAFHAYSNNTNPEVLEAALNVLNGYSWSKFHRTFQIAITESNYKIFDESLEKDHTYHYNFRTFPLVLATLALIRHPDQVFTRLMFDLHTPGDKCNCRLYNGSDSQELQFYALLGHLREGTRLLVTNQFTSVTEKGAIGAGGTGILVEAVQSGTNYTLALVNTLDVAVTVKLEFNHTVTRAQSSWAGMMDVHSLRDIPAPQFPSGTVELPPKSIFLATYDNQKMPQTPKKKKEYLTIYPEDSSTIMVPIRSATFEISVDFVIPSSILKQSYVVTLQFGSLGPPSHAVWTGVVDCYKNGTKFTVVAREPGIFYQTPIPFWVFDPTTEYQCSVHLSMSGIEREHSFEHQEANADNLLDASTTGEHPGEGLGIYNIEKFMQSPSAVDEGHDIREDYFKNHKHYPAVFQFCSLLIETL